MDDQLVRDVVAAATLAPSTHNSQPWRFVATGDGVQLWADRSRALPVVDPAGRALHLSCGAALLLGELAARAHGVGCTTVLLPDPAEPDHLGDWRFGRESTAGADDLRLASAITARHTDRRPFDARPVPAELVHRLAAAVQAEGCWLSAVDDPDRAASVAVALAHADEALLADPAYLEELRRWTGRKPDAPDGIPSGAAIDLATRGSTYRLRDLDPAHSGTAAQHEPADLPPPAEHPLLVVLGTDADWPLDWLRAGRALGRLLLTAVTEGLAASPMTQALEVADTRARLTRDLGLVGHPQMILRIGYPPPGAPPADVSGRRPVEDVLQTR